MAINPRHIDLLYRAQDNPLSPVEERELALALEQSPGLRAERDKLLRLRDAFGQIEPPPEPDFTAQVMAGLQARVVPLRWLRRVAAACLLLLAAAFLTLYFSEGSLSTDTLIGVQELQPEDATALAGEWSIN
ncbi:MAG TPA: hypothetical protein VJ933_00395 [Phaeodactylibacter sp.]|nr:hypothetical protein [Phaeodactylibacter sp.]